MIVIPTQPIPAQELAIVLADQACRIVISQKLTGMFLSLYVNDVLVIGGVVCLNNVRIVRSAYLGFVGDLVFTDTAGADDPSYLELGTRFLLLYLNPSDLT